MDLWIAFHELHGSDIEEKKGGCKICRNNPILLKERKKEILMFSKTKFGFLLSRGRILPLSMYYLQLFCPYLYISWTFLCKVIVILYHYVT